MKVIFVSFVHLSSRISKEFHIDYLIKNNIEVEYWDVVNLFFIEKNHISYKNESVVKYISNYNELKSLLNIPENSKSIFFFNISHGSKFLKIHELFMNFNCSIFYISKDALPVSHTSKSFIKKISIHIFSPLKFLKILIDIFLQRFYRITQKVTSYEVIFKTGQSYLSILSNCNKIVYINHPDFEVYKNTLKINDIHLTEKFAVFLDVNMAYHYDLKIQGLKRVNIDSYFTSLNNFFDIIENQYSLKVIIAAHPSVEYKSNEFMGRRICYSDTANLVKNSEFVISHHSTSVSFAILNEKPLIFIYTTEMQKLYSNSILLVIEASANYLDSTIINIDKINKNDSFHFTPVNINAYSNYKYNFLTSDESENKNSCDIILDTIVSYKQ